MHVNDVYASACVTVCVYTTLYFGCGEKLQDKKLKLIVIDQDQFLVNIPAVSGHGNRQKEKKDKITDKRRVHPKT